MASLTWPGTDHEVIRLARRSIDLGKKLISAPPGGDHRRYKDGIVYTMRLHRDVARYRRANGYAPGRHRARKDTVKILGYKFTGLDYVLLFLGLGNLLGTGWMIVNGESFGNWVFQLVLGLAMFGLLTLTLFEKAPKLANHRPRWVKNDE